MSIYKYVKLCKCGKRFLSKNSRKQKCPTCDTKKKHPKHKKRQIPVQEKKQVYLRDGFACRICRKDLTANPFDCCCVKLKASREKITVCRKDVRLAKNLRFEELKQFDSLAFLNSQQKH